MYVYTNKTKKGVEMPHFKESFFYSYAQICHELKYAATYCITLNIKNLRLPKNAQAALLPEHLFNIKI